MIKKLLLATLFSCSVLAGPHKMSFDSSNVCMVDGQKIFPLSVAVIPPPDGKTPDGKSAWEALSEGGINFARIAPMDCTGTHGWNDAGFQKAEAYMREMAPRNIHVWMTIGQDLSYTAADDQQGQEKLKTFIKRFKDNPAMAAWKGADEPLWGNMNTNGKRPPASIATVYKIVHELDPDHPVMVLQAPRGTAEELATYAPYLDVTGMDVFPISYPPGGHVAKWPNKEISSVGDWTKIVMQGSAGKPVWMTLQIAFSGTTKPGKTLRFPNFAEERFMTYEAIICGARGINWFGGSIDVTLNERDEKLGYNWTFWDRILKPLVAELNDKSPLHEALIAPNSKLPVKVQEAEEGLEYVVREVGDEVFVLACKREGKTVQAHFTGLPSSVSTGDVLYEEPRKVEVKDGAFADWFAPFDVHVYRFKR
jgi:hypothetical protein